MCRAVTLGDYFCTARDLYHVEHVAGDHALVEDCRSGELVDIPLDELLRLTRLREPLPSVRATTAKEARGG